MINQYDVQQQMLPQGYGQNSLGYGPQTLTAGWGQAAFGQPIPQYLGQSCGQQFGHFGGYGAASAWGQRQLSPQDTGEIVRQLIPVLPQILAQTQQYQQQPQAAFGGGYGQRTLTQQDVNDVVRQILPVVAQLQGQNPMQAMATGLGFLPLGGQQQPFGYQQAFGNNPSSWQQGWPQAAFGGGQHGSHRHLNQQDVNEVVRQLTAILPQVIQNLQGQQRTM